MCASLPTILFVILQQTSFRKIREICGWGRKRCAENHEVAERVDRKQKQKQFVSLSFFDFAPFVPNVAIQLLLCHSKNRTIAK